MKASGQMTETETIRISFKLRKDQYDKLLELMKRNGCLTISEYIRRLINEKLKEVS